MDNIQNITIDFEPIKHEYTVNGEKAKISVTTLVEKQISKTDWGTIDPIILQKAAERGTDVHADLEYFVGKGAEPRTEECRNFANYLKANNWTIEDPLCEFKLAIRHTAQTSSGSYVNFILTGTADLICKLNGKYVVIDHKTTSIIHEEYVRWQMSLLDYMARKLNGKTINGRLFTYHPSEEMYVFHFNKQAIFKPVKVDKISDVEIERLLDAEARDEEYYPTPIDILTPKQESDLVDIQKKLCSLKLAQKQLTEQEALLRKEMEQAFQAHPDVKKLELESVSIAYTAPTTRTVFDTARFQKDYPDLYSQYLTQQPVKGSVTITLAKNIKDYIEAHSSEAVIPQLPKPLRKNTKRGYFN